MKLRENESRKLISEIELAFLPRKEEIIKFNSKQYKVLGLIHSETEIEIIVKEEKENITFFF